MKIRQLLLALGLVLVLGVSASACEAKPEPPYAGDITENILVALDTSDYHGYIRDFDPTMRLAVTEAAFNEVTLLLKTQRGDYWSRKFWKTEVSGGYTIVYYRATFSRESEDVIIKIVFDDSGDKILVAGLWFE